MSNVEKNELKNLKNDLKISSENLGKAIEVLEDSMRDADRTSTLDKSIDKRREFELLRTDRDVQFTMLELLERILERLDKIIKDDHGPIEPTPTIPTPIDFWYRKMPEIICQGETPKSIWGINHEWDAAIEEGKQSDYRDFMKKYAQQINAILEDDAGKI